MKTIFKSKKLVLCLAMVLCVVASVFAFTAVPADAAEAVDSTYTFAKDKYYVMESPIVSAGGFTFEAEFSVPYEYKTSRAGVIIGNYDDHAAEDRATGKKQSKALSVELYHESSKKKVRVYTRGEGDIKFDYDLNKDLYESDGKTPKYIKIAVVVDTSKTTDNYLLYVNGVLKCTATNSDADFKDGCFKTEENMWVGADPRKENAQFFKGSIKNVAVYDDIRTAEEIANDAVAFNPDATDANLICAYDLNTLKVNEGYLKDLSAKKNDATNPNWKVDGIGKTFTASDDLHLVKDIDVMPQTFEAVVYAPKSVGRTGVIFGNYMGSPACLNFEIHSSGMATIHLDPDKDSGAVTAKIADVRSDAGFRHLVIVRVEDDLPGYTYQLYIDGQYVAETKLKDKNGNVVTEQKFDSLDMAEVQSTYKLQLGGDSRSNNERWFRGNMKDVALYSEPLTAEEIYASYKNGVGTVRSKDNGLILHYDMNTLESSDYVLDVSGNDYHVTQGGVSMDTFSQGRGFTAEEMLYVQKKLEVMPGTYEALVYVPSDNRSGVILGNYGGSTCVNFEIHGSSSTPRLPSIYITDANGETMSTKFNYSLTPNAWAHIVVTHEVTSSGATFTCYVNGEKVDSFSTDKSYAFDSSVNDDNYLVLGGDCRSANEQYYKGKIKNVALYGDVLTADEIKALYANGVDADNESLILYYDLTKESNQTGKVVVDESGNGYNTGSANITQFHPRENEIGDYDYAFAIVGDTQKLAYHDVHNEDGEPDYAHYIYDWLVANKDSKKIKLVMGVGDITDKNEDAEYELMKAQFEKLAAAGIFYTITPGNHDMASGKYEKYNKYFVGYGNEGEVGYIPALSSLVDKVAGYYGPIVDGVRTEDKTQLTNYYVKTEIEGEKFIVFSFEYGAPDDVLAWAGDVCDANKDYKVIITTHAYMYRDGTTLDAGDVVPPNKTDSTSDDHRNNGDMVWDKFVSQHENIVMVFSGHDPCANIILRQDAGVSGNIVSQFLVDFQSMDTKLSFETGMVAMLYISKNGNVKVEYVSTYQTAVAQQNDPNAPDMLYKERNSFSFNMYEYPEELVTKYGLIPQQYSNSALYPFIIFDENGNCIGAESFLFDRVSEYNNEGAFHKAKVYLQNNVWENDSFGENERRAYILLRGDYVMASNENYNNVAQLRGTVVIDLDGHTITTPDGRALVTSTIKPWAGRIDPTIIHFINGSINITNTSVVKFDAWNSTDSTTGVTTYVDTKIFSYTFENINFKVSSNVSTALISYTQHNSTPTAIGNPDASFVNCTFDLTDAKEGMKLFDLGNGYVDTKITVVGCEIILGTNSVVLVSENDVSGGATTLDGSVTFEKNANGSYMTVTAPKGVALPELEANGGALAFVKIGETDETVKYALSAAALDGYKIKTSITLYSNFVYNIYIPAKDFVAATVNGKAVTYTEVTVNDVLYYQVKVDLAAGETLADIKLTVTVKVGDETVDANWTLSVVNYAKAVLGGNYDDTTKTLMKDMLVYASAAHTYFKNTEAVAEKLAEIKTLLGDYAAEMPIGEAKAPADKTYFTDVAVYLGEVPSFRFYLASGYTAADFSFKVGNRTVEAKASEDGKYVEIVMYAYMMLDDVTFTVKTTGATGTYNLYSYYEYAKTLNNANLTAVVEALMKYAVSASNYRTSVINK